MIQTASQAKPSNSEFGLSSQEYCDLCGNEKKGRHYSSATNHDILQCPSCRLLWTSPLLRGKPVYAGEETYVSNEIPQKVRFRKQLRLFMEKTGHTQPESLRVLEIGSGLGYFLDVCEEAGIKAEGCDIAAEAIAYANRTRSRVREGTLDSYYPSESFDAIFAFNLIEHLPHPALFLREAYRALKPNGTLVLETPTQDSLFHRLGRVGDICSRGKFALYGMAPSGHIYKFSKKTFGHLAKSEFDILYAKNVASPWSEIWGNSSSITLENRGLYRFSLPIVYLVAEMTGQENRMLVMLRKRGN